MIIFDSYYLLHSVLVTLTDFTYTIFFWYLMIASLSRVLISIDQ